MIDVEQCHNKSDAELVKLSLQQSDYFACLVNRYEAKLTNYIRKITNLDAEDVADVLQDVFIKVYKNLNSFDPGLKFSSWIYRITHNQVISNYRKNTARPQTVPIEIDDTIIHNLASDLDTSQAVDEDLLRQNINAVLEKLDIKYREVLVLKFLEDKDYKEISDILKKPAGTVGTLINRAKAKFRKELQASKLNLK
ncbi:MAG: sigma-70 family RNA polymerase sigma factor [bacterium]